MSNGYAAVSETEEVRAAQARLGSRTAMARRSRSGSPADPEPRDPLGPAERDFITSRDGFYLATVSSTGWPYVQFRGGPPGFIRVPDVHSLAWADFRGNRQYVSTGNVAGEERVSLFFMDYPHQSRLKVFGRARIRDARDDPDLAAELAVPGYPGVVEQAVVVTVVAHDWNCPQHITPRFSAVELQALGVGLGGSARECPADAR